MNLTLVLGLVAGGLVLYIVGVYNDLASMRTRIAASIQEIGNQLKRQAELIPNLETSAKAYLKHETGILKMLSDARKLISSGKDASAKVSEILDTSDKVMYSRRTLIDLTADYNIKLVTFPSKLVANAFGFQTEKGFETPASGDFLSVSDAETKTPKVSL
ncbi:MAG: LemA family protein [Candidatus Gottesmanbacteria bacterium GW2011_GWA1_48_13]|uniref:LemA family protein n=1 Tax=Candidatus Gottesmanbacteria bacterium GW2011_GWA1_48_13 TaxID=1618439 RepID=A0A0G1XLM4_9BACT|nr:MAG: LemA family protein [Candidatus Gottesmanbacteria bacterium GW2011_GWA1_48_13]